MLSRLSTRRTLVGGITAAGLVASLVSVGVVALSGTAQAANCPAWTDPAGDASTAGIPPLTDANLDITSTSFGTVGQSMIIRYTAADLAEGASDLGDEYGLEFVVDGVEILVYADRDPLGGDASAVLGPDVSAEATAVYDAAKDTVTVTFPIASLNTAAGKNVVGKTISGLRAYTSNIVPLVALPLLPYDESTTAATTVVGTACTFVAPVAPAPTTSAAPSASASASASPRPSSSASAAPSSAAPSASTSATATASGSAGPKDEPLANCFTFTDPAGDADPQVPLVGGTGQEDDLDIVGVTFRTTDTALKAYLEIAALDTAPAAPFFDGHSFSVGFTHAAKDIVLTATESGPSTGTVGGTANADLAGTAVFDIATSQVIFSVPLAGVAKAAAAPFAVGTQVTKTNASSTATGPIVDGAADTAASEKPAEQVYTLGDNRCFAAAATPRPSTTTVGGGQSSGGSSLRVKLSGPTRVQFRDNLLTLVTLTDGNGAPVVNRRVSGKLGSTVVAVGSTNSKGQLRLKNLAGDPAGKRNLVITVAGVNGSGTGGVKLNRAITTIAETTTLTKAYSGSGATRTLVVTLADDDRPGQVLADKVVTVAFGGTTRSGRTDADGRVTFRVPADEGLRIRFAGESGRYAAAQSDTRAPR